MNDNTERFQITPPRAQNKIVMTVDVEDYFMSPECIPFEDWPNYEPAIHQGMQRTLSLLESCNAKATFFFVGWLAERYPELVRQTAEAGHEIASHSYAHTYIHQMNPHEFEASVAQSLEVLNAACPQQKIIGFRAPAFSLERGKTWQFDILTRYGMRYDSSIIPIQNYLYGDRTAPRHPYRIGKILEIPPSTIELAGRKFPVGGGGTLRLFPQWFTTFARQRYQGEGYLPVIYMHPWEMVPEHPPLRLPVKQRMMHYIGLQRFSKKLRTILASNQAMTMGEYYQILLKAQD
jgi:polysaccharide deacetylase family protein (PEP-CTERM system associated)